MTPKIEEKNSSEQDEYYSENNRSPVIDNKYMTPKVHTFRPDENPYFHRTQEQIPIQEYRYSSQNYGSS